MEHLNSDQLRIFLAIAEAGSVTGGALCINRSQSATSLQIRQLELVIGQPLFKRHGRGVVLSPAGEKLLPVARRVAATLDHALAELRGSELHGRLRIGLPDNHSQSALTRIVAGFAERHPDVELEVHSALGSGFGAALRSGALDIAVHEVPEPGDRDEILREDRLVWMVAQDRDFNEDSEIPVAVFDRDCWWRELALRDLEAAGLRYRLAFTSESAIGVRSAVEAGIAVGLMSGSDDQSGLVPFGALPHRHASFLVIQKALGLKGAVSDAICAAIRNAFQPSRTNNAG